MIEHHVMRRAEQWVWRRSRPRTIRMDKLVRLLDGCAHPLGHLIESLPKSHGDRMLFAWVEPKKSKTKENAK